MSPSLQTALFCALSAVLSSIVTFLVLQAKAARDQASAAVLRSTLEERIKARDDQISEVKRQAGEDEITIADLRERLSARERNVERLESELRRERKVTEEKLKLLAEAEASFKDTFQALSANALKSNNESFLELARLRLEQVQQRSFSELDERQKAIDALVKPISESLAKVDSKIEQVERTRSQAHGDLNRHLEMMREAQSRLHGETANLVKALRAPAVRGRWGEIQLRRVVEVAGMVEYCDFTQQETIHTDDGRRRPDMVVKLPNHRCVVIDSKVPLSHYLEALDAPDEHARIGSLRSHAAQVRKHLAELSSKSYQDNLDTSPEFVVLFLPGETLFSAALEQDPSLIEFGAEQKVILATPTTLIALLKAVAYGWRQEQLADNAREISENGRILYERIRTLASHLIKVGSGLGRAVDAYNKAVGSLERSVLPAARRFKDLGAATSDDIPTVGEVEKMTRALAIPELSISAAETVEVPVA